MTSILMIEHDSDDRFITSYVFEEKHPGIDITFVNNFDEAVDFLTTRKVLGESLPRLILLNYHASPKTAEQIIRELKASDFASIPVVVLSGSANPAAAKECYAAGAASFIIKPSDASGTEKKISNFINYWFETATV